MNLRGRVVLLTGATGGIGRSSALLLARAGARLALFARTEGRLLALAAEVSDRGGEALAVPGDVRNVDDARRAVRETVGRFGALHALVNGAGLAYMREAGEATDAEIREQIETNYLGVCNMTRAALPELMLEPGRALVNIASFAGKVGAPYYGYYGATKFALVGLTESWRRELGARGLHVTTVLPAAVETPFLDRAGRTRALGRGLAGVKLKPEEVARAVVKALERHPPVIFLPATHRLWTLVNEAVPSIADRVLRSLFGYPRDR